MSAGRRGKRLALGLVLLVAAAGAVGWWLRPIPRPRNVIVVLIDTLRADHVSALGYERQTTPFIDRLAHEGIVFEQAMSAASATFPAVNSLFTSQPPSVFYRSTGSDLGIPDEMTTIAEVFQAAGFRTGAVSASPVVRRSPSRVNAGGGFGQGFEDFDERCLDNRKVVPPFTAGCVTEQAIAMIDSFGDSRFFLYVHYLDPHDPYRPPEGWNRFAQPYTGDKPFIAAGVTPPIARWLYEGGEDPHLTQADVQHLIDLYDDEILAVDFSVRWLVTHLKELGRLDDTLLVLLSDHGESFMEHGHIQHGRSAYQTELHIPLVFHWPHGWPRPERRSEPACGVDVMPTILRVVGLPMPADAWGVPLFGWFRAGRSCFSEARADWRARRGNLVALRSGARKIIHDRRRNAYEMYDLAADPAELANLVPAAGTDGGPFAVLRDNLDALTRTLTVAAPAEEGPVALEPDTERALRALGYVE